jgi:hypothetical protein
MRLLLAFCLLFLGIFNAQGSAMQKPVAAKKIYKSKIVKKPLVLKIDSSTIDLRTIDQNAVDSFSKQKDFIYDDVVPEKQSLWDRFWAWVWRTINKILDNKVGGGIVKYILIALAVAIVVFVIIKLIGLDYKLLAGKSKNAQIPYQETLENIHEIDFDEQIEKALQEHNYRLVVRLLYLKTLKQLSDKHLIVWLPEKTNQSYVLEIANDNQRQDFAQLTNQFEYIWYGEFFIDKESFETINQSFNQFNQFTK